MEYHVTWEIDLDADSPREAAEKALEIQRDVFLDALYFEVTDENDTTVGIDLGQE